jgi:2-polyprenyl-6-methoxyphenol hydroxylase-like FAD-dependent oxidoreductase
VSRLPIVALRQPPIGPHRPSLGREKDIRRAIAYDAETLRLFAQIGLFDSIADGLIQVPRVVYLNARGGRLMEMNPPRSAYGHSPLGTFYQPSFERALLAGLNRFASARAFFRHHVTGLDFHGVGEGWRRQGGDGRKATLMGLNAPQADRALGDFRQLRQGPLVA